MLFTSDDCTHCDDVIAAIEDNDLEDYATIEYYEISTTENRALFDEKVEICKLGDSEIGVPMLFYDNQCMVSSTLVIDELNSSDTETNIEKEPTTETETPPDTEIYTDLPNSTSSAKVENPTQTLNSALYGEQTPPTETTSFTDILAIVFPITLFGAIAYLLIKNFKL